MQKRLETIQHAPVMSAQRVSVIGAMLVAIGPISLALYTPAMPEIVSAFGTTEAAVKMTLTAYFAGFALAQLVCGPLSDGLGRKPVTFSFMAIYAVASLIALVAPTVEMLIAARFLQGVGAAVGVAISRAVVRDLFTQEQSARIMNVMGMIITSAPAFAPTVGGLIMEFFGWHAIFLAMLAFGLALVVVVQCCMRETVMRDVSRIRPRQLTSAYASLLKSPYFLTSSLIMAGTSGALYAQATILPFILMDRVGLTATQFGIGMLMQSGMFFLGALSVRFLMRHYSAFQLVPAGLCSVAIGGSLLAILLNVAPVSFLLVMGPVAFFAYGMAFVIPAMMTAALAPFPHIAGAASSLSGFMQMGAGLVGGSIAALVGDPVLAMSTIIPAMGAMAILAWFFWRRLPEPSIAAVTSIPSDISA